MTITQKFTTKELDQGIDLTYFGARYYDQDLGVWTSPDPSRQFHSVYAYGASPVNSIDPDGKWEAKVTAGYGPAGQVSFGKNQGQWSWGVKVGVGVGLEGSFNPANTRLTPLQNATPARIGWEARSGFRLGSAGASISYTGNISSNSTTSHMENGFGGGVAFGQLTAGDLFGVPTAGTINTNVDFTHSTNAVNTSVDLQTDNSVGLGGGSFGLFGLDFWGGG